MSGSHPSFFALDAHALGAGEPGVAEHVAGCQVCAAHVAAARVASPLPPAIASLERPAAASPWSGWRSFGFAFAALAAALLVTVLVREPQRGDETTAKGLPAARLWWKHGEKTAEWRGEKLVAGDAVRVEVAPAGFARVTVFDEQSGEVLYDARVDGGAPVLTPAWSLDGRAPAEKLRVVLSRAADKEPPAPGTACGGANDAWCTQFTLELAPEHP